MNNLASIISQSAIEEFCHRWGIRELALFGSALRNDFSLDSDIDLLVSFTNNTKWSLLDHIQMQNELQKLFKRDVDLVSRRAIEKSSNWLRRQEILNTAKIIFATDEALHAA